MRVARILDVGKQTAALQYKNLERTRRHVFHSHARLMKTVRSSMVIMSSDGNLSLVGFVIKMNVLFKAEVLYEKKICTTFMYNYISLVINFILIWLICVTWMRLK